LDEARSDGNDVALESATAIADQVDVLKARRKVLNVYFAPDLERYSVELVLATRDAQVYDEALAAYIRLGASPRATIALNRAARAHAWLDGRDYVSPEDVHSMVPDVLRHRLILTYAAQAHGVDADDVISMLLDRMPIP
jgi:MoxR-like ATPase